MSGRLLFRVEPIAGESPRGYLCRVAHEHGYGSPVLMAEIAGLQASSLDGEDAIKKLSYVLRLEPEEWRTMCYHHVVGRKPQRSFCGKRISADDLNYGSPRLCPVCLCERLICLSVWDLALVVACPVHRCVLANRCSACHRRITWRRPAVHQCVCDFDFRELRPNPADPDLLAISAVLYRAAGFTLAQSVNDEIAVFGLPPELVQLKLGPLLRLILFVGSISEARRYAASNGLLVRRISLGRRRSAAEQLHCSEIGLGIFVRHYGA